MKYRSSLLGFIVVLLTMPLFARDKTDSLVMKNGDRMTCEVKGLTAGVLYVSFDYIDGTTSVDWSKVAKLERSHVISMVATSDKFWERFNGAINFGTTFSKGNESTQYSLGSQTAYVRERWSAQANYDSNLASSTGATTSTRNSLVTSVYHLLPWNNWFYAGLGSFLQSSEQGISFQSTLGGGVG